MIRVPGKVMMHCQSVTFHKSLSLRPTGLRRSLPSCRDPYGPTPQKEHGCWARRCHPLTAVPTTSQRGSLATLTVLPSPFKQDDGPAGPMPLPV